MRAGYLCSLLAKSSELTSEHVVPWAPRDDRKDVTCCCLDSIIPSTFSLLGTSKFLNKTRTSVFPKDLRKTSGLKEEVYSQW